MPRNVREARDVGERFGTVYKNTFSSFGKVREARTDRFSRNNPRRDLFLARHPHATRNTLSCCRRRTDLTESVLPDISFHPLHVMRPFLSSIR